MGDVNKAARQYSGKFLHEVIQSNKSNSVFINTRPVAKGEWRLLVTNDFFKYLASLASWIFVENISEKRNQKSYLILKKYLPTLSYCFNLLRTIVILKYLTSYCHT